MECKVSFISLLRAVFASLGSAQLADILGRKMVLLGALVISFIAIGVEFVATTNAVFFVGKLLNGFMVGTIGTVMISYIGEVRNQSSPCFLSDVPG